MECSDCSDYSYSEPEEYLNWKLVDTLWEALKIKANPNGGSPMLQIEILLKSIEPFLDPALGPPITHWVSFRKAWKESNPEDTPLDAKNAWKLYVSRALIGFKIFENMPGEDHQETDEDRYKDHGYNYYYSNE